MPKINFSNNLINLRESNNLNKSNLANILGITRQAVHAYETGSVNPSLEVLAKLTEVFNCTIDSLLFDNSELNMSKYTRINSIVGECNYSAINELNKIKSELLEKQAILSKSISDIEKSISILEKESNGKYEFANDLELEISQNITPFIDKKTVKILNSSSSIKNDTIPIPKIGYISAGTPKYACENIEEYFNISKSDLNIAKEYFILEIKGNSMNNLYQDKELVLVDASNVDVSDKPVIVLVDNSDATVKYVELNHDNNTFKLIPSSTFDKYKSSVYSFKNHALHILGTVVGIVKQEEE